MPAILATAAEIASAMSHLHKRNVVHGDLTGHNVLLMHGKGDARGFQAKVCDFGLARVLQNLMASVQTRTYGTVTHAPPELLGAGKLTKAADAYAFGVLLWEMYCGAHAWAGLSQLQIMTAVLVAKRTLTFPPGTPPRFKELATACLAPSPEARPTFDGCLQLLARCFGEARSL
jgi:serine/threonine protein kinase